MPVEVVLAHVKAAGGFSDGEQLIGFGGRGVNGRGQTGKSGISHLFDFSQEAWKLVGGQFLCDP